MRRKQGFDPKDIKMSNGSFQSSLCFKTRQADVFHLVHPVPESIKPLSQLLTLKNDNRNAEKYSALQFPKKPRQTSKRSHQSFSFKLLHH